MKYGRSSVFTKYYPQKIQQTDNIIILTHSTVLNLETNSTGQNVTNINVGSIAGNRFRIRAKIYILAAGGIENARLLLLSNTCNSSGLGNQNDVLGRFFMDRPQIDLGLFIPFSRQLLNQTKLYDIHTVYGSPILGSIGLKTQLLSQQKLPNHEIQLYPTYHGDLARAKISFEKIKSSLIQGKLPDEFTHHLDDFVCGYRYFTDAFF